MIIAAARRDLNASVFISHDVGWLAKNGAGSGAWTGHAVKRQTELAVGCPDVG
jgi:hypothetical protein